MNNNAISVMVNVNDAISLFISDSRCNTCNSFAIFADVAHNVVPG